MLVEFSGLAVAAMALGMRHGLDVDHLATVDGLTRSRDAAGHGCSRACGAWFAVGHGLTIAGIATAIATLGHHADMPAWLEATGRAIAVGTLAVLGGANLWMARRAGARLAPAPVSIRHWIVRRLAGRVGGPAAIVVLGSVFAISLDAVATAAVFAASTVALGTPWAALALALAFAIGMTAVDGLAGCCSAWFLRRSHALASAARGVSATLFGVGCLAAAAALLAEPMLTRAAGFSRSQGLMLSAGVWLMVPMTYGATWCLLAANLHRAPNRTVGHQGDT